MGVYYTGGTEVEVQEGFRFVYFCIVLRFLPFRVDYIAMQSKSFLLSIKKGIILYRPDYTVILLSFGKNR